MNAVVNYNLTVSLLDMATVTNPVGAIIIDTYGLTR